MEAAHSCARCGKEVQKDKAVLGLPRLKYYRRGILRVRARRPVDRTFCSARCRKAAGRYTRCPWCLERGEWAPDDGELTTCAHCFGTGWLLCEVCGERPAERVVTRGLVSTHTCKECAPRHRERAA